MKKSVTICKEQLLLGKKAFNRWECAVLFILISILIVAYGYNDTIFLIRHGMNVWGTVFEGDGILAFYTYNHVQAVQQQELGLLACDAMYDFPLYLIMAVWDLPLWMINKLSGIDVAATWWGILYGKMLFVAFAYVGALIIEKICLLLGVAKYKAEWAPIIYMTSLITISSVYIIGQCDSIGIVFILAGTYYYLKDDWKRFLICFSIAISMKFFAVLVFAVLLVAREKRVLYIIGNMVAGVSVTLLSRLLFSTESTVGNAVKDDFSSNMLQVIMQNKMPFVNGAIPVSVFLVCLVIGVCYLQKEMQKRKLIWWIFIVNFVFFVSFDGTPYWYLYLGVMTVMVLVASFEYEKEKILLLTLGECALMGAHYIRYYWCYDVDKVNRTVVGKFFGMSQYTENSVTLQKVATMPSAQLLISFLYTMFLVTFLIVVFSNFIRRDREETLLEENQWRRMMRCRIVCNMIVGYVPLVIYFVNRLVEK